MQDYFRFKSHGTTLRREIVGGMTTFLAAMYIIVVNPSIISASGMPFEGVVTATVLVSAFSSILMGIYANNPIVIAPGMGLNAYFTYSVVLGMGVEWETALGAVFWSGIIFLILSIFRVRTYIVKAIPRQIRYGVAAGIGIFIALIGFVNSGFIVPSETTVVDFGPLNAVTLTFIAGLFITAIFIVRRTRGAIILAIIITTILAVPIGRWYGDASVVMQGQTTLVNWQGLFALPDFSVFLAMNMVDSLRLAMWPVIFALLFTDLFDSLSTFIGVAEAAKLTDKNGEPRNIKKSLIVDAAATTASGIFGTSSGTAYIESAAGIEEGGRTGLTAVIAGVMFLPFIFVSPLLSIVPEIATAPALVLVGVFMMKPVKQINWNTFDDAIPAFLSMVLIPLTYSITQGIIWGFLSWTVVKIALGKTDDVSPMLLIIDLFAILALLI